MTKEREILELVSEYVQTRAQAEAGVEPVGRTLEDIAEAFGQALRGQGDSTDADRIPPIVTREEEGRPQLSTSEMEAAHKYLPVTWAD